MDLVMDSVMDSFMDSVMDSVMDDGKIYIKILDAYKCNDNKCISI